jgi:acyl-CoA thioester hydrolase
MGREFILPLRVYYEDTDAGGVVYHANYLNFMERGRTEWLRSLGYEQDSLRQEQGILFAVRSMEIDFIRPARFNDEITVTCRVDVFGKASLVFEQSIIRAEETLCHATVKIACIDASRFRPAPIPGDMLSELKNAI